MDGGHVHAYALGRLEAQVNETILFLDRFKAQLTEPQKEFIDSINKTLEKVMSEGNAKIKEYNDSL